MDEEKKQIEEIASDICPFYKDYGSCERCNKELDTDGEPCYFMHMAMHIVRCGYRKQIEGKWTRIEVRGKNYAQVYYQHNDCEVNETQMFPSPYNSCPNCGAKMKGGESDA